MRRLLMCLLTPIVLLPSVVEASPASQPGAGAFPTLSAQQQQRIVSKAQAALHDRYIFPAVGDRAAALIGDRLRSGAYRDEKAPEAFALALTTDLQSVTHDKHLRVNAPPWNPGKPPPSILPLSQMGVVRADLLVGGVGYIELIGFLPLDAAMEPLDKAMRSLSGSKALIVDLRRNGGGDPKTVSHLVSWFLPRGKRVLINEFIKRNPGTLTYQTERFYSKNVRRPFTRTRVLILTSSETFSGAEEFAYDMKVMHLAKSIGEATGGGANPGGGVDLGFGLSVFLPDGRARNPLTKTNWEGVGVRPDLAVPADQGLIVALKSLGVGDAVGSVDAQSRQRTFTPNQKPPPAGNQVVRLLVAGLASSRPRYDLMSPGAVKDSREDLARMKKEVAELGPIHDIAFEKIDELGGTVYNLKFAYGRARSIIVTRSDGKVALFFLNKIR